MQVVSCLTPLPRLRHLREASYRSSEATTQGLMSKKNGGLNVTVAESPSGARAELSVRNSNARDMSK